MPLTPPQRKALHRAASRGGTQPDQIPPNTLDLLTAAGLLSQHDPDNDGTWTILITKAGRAELAKPAAHTPLYLAHPSRHTSDYTEHRHLAIDDLEVVPPSKTRIDEARKRGEQQRASFRRDLEQERQRRKNDRVRMFRDVA